MRPLRLVGTRFDQNVFRFSQLRSARRIMRNIKNYPQIETPPVFLTLFKRGTKHVQKQ